MLHGGSFFKKRPPWPPEALYKYFFFIYNYNMEALIVLISEFILVLVIAGIVFLISGLLMLLTFRSNETSFRGKERTMDFLKLLQKTDNMDAEASVSRLRYRLRPPHML